MATKALKTTEPKTAPAAEPAAEKKERAPRQDYGFRKGATITITEKEVKYRGKRLEYFEILKKHDGKTIEKFFSACPEGDPPRGWLRFFVTDGAATLEGGEEPEVETEEQEEAPKAKGRKAK
jgi:hypothetical protein